MSSQEAKNTSTELKVFGVIVREDYESLIELLRENSVYT